MSKQNQMGTPHLVSMDATTTIPLERLPFSPSSGVNEAWLQTLIHEQPHVLPVNEVFAQASGAIISIGREISVPAGFIDNLLITQSGHLVLVETKLWRNPQARREVVAQILDYAAYVKSWTYDDLEAAWRGKSNDKPTLYEAVRPDQDEGAWVDVVSQRLAVGEMLLLIVGDGIRSQAQTLAESVGVHPGMLFRLAMVQLQLYKTQDGQILVVPNTLMRTEEVERATVRVLYDGAQPDVKVDFNTNSPSGSKHAGTTLDAQVMLRDLESAGQDVAAKVVRELLNQLKSYDGELIVDWKSGSFAIKTLDPVKEGEQLSLVVVGRPNSFYAYWEWIRAQISKNWGDEAAGLRIGGRLSTLLVEQFGAKETHKGLQASMSLTQLEGREAEIVKALAEFVAMIRAEAASRDMR